MPETDDNWIKKAEEDYWTAVQLSLVRKSTDNGVLCLNAQRCVERYLKAILQRHGVQIQESPTLEQLLDDCARCHPMLELMRPDIYTLARHAGLYRDLVDTTDKQEARELVVRNMHTCRNELRHVLGLPSPGGTRKSGCR